MFKRDDIEIHVLSARAFKNLMQMNGINDTNVESFKDCAMISINDPDEPEEAYFKYDHANVLSFFFHDVTYNDGYCKLMSEADAKKMFELIHKVAKDEKIKHFIIHCQAGISRSGGVGAFIQEFFGIDYDSFKTKNPQIHPNHLVKSLLFKEAKNTYKNIAIIGGSFNPITLGHMELAKHIALVSNIDEIWLVPNDKSVFGKNLVSWEDRSEMVRIIANQLDREYPDIKFKMSDIEHTEKLDGYTISLHDALTTKYPTYNFYYVIGKDIANSIEKYKFYDKLIKDCQFIVCDRPGYESNGNTWYLKGKHIYLEDVGNLIQASSTELREKILNGNIEELKEKISIDVLNYIIEHKLYSNEK